MKKKNSRIDNNKPAFFEICLKIITSNNIIMSRNEAEACKRFLYQPIPRNHKVLIMKQMFGFQHCLLILTILFGIFYQSIWDLF